MSYWRSSGAYGVRRRPVGFAVVRSALLYRLLYFPSALGCVPLGRGPCAGLPLVARLGAAHGRLIQDGCIRSGSGCSTPRRLPAENVTISLLLDLVPPRSDLRPHMDR